jgi:predicted MFS family arabinose efflux permease
MTLFNGVLEAVFLLYLTRKIGFTPLILGVIFAISSVGFVVGALLSGRLTRRLGIGMIFLLTPLVIGGSDLIIPLVGLISALAFPLVGLAQFCFGLAKPVFSITQVSLRQSITPSQLQGRVNATGTWVVFGIPIIGALLGGLLGQSVGLQKTLVIAGLGECMACLWIVFSPVRSVQDEHGLPGVLPEAQGAMALSQAE